MKSSGNSDRSDSELPEALRARLFLDSKGDNFASLSRDIEATLELVRLWWSGIRDTRTRPGYPSPRPADREAADIANEMEERTPHLTTPFANEPALLGLMQELSRSPRFNARNFVNIHATPAIPAVAAVLAASIQNQNLTDEEVSPAYTRESGLEPYCINELAGLVGFPADTACGHFTTGGTLANLTAVLVARDKALRNHFAVPGRTVLRNGLFSLKGSCAIIATAATHYSITKCAWVAGIGAENVVRIPTLAEPDEWDSYQAGAQSPFGLGVDEDALLRNIRSLKERNTPIVAVVPTVGTTSTGLIERPSVFVKALQSEGLLDSTQVHVDAAMGGLALYDPDVKTMVGDLAGVNSVTIDPHKWGYVPYPCGSVIFRNRSDYAVLESPNRSANLHRLQSTIEGSRAATGVAAFWATLRALGSSGFLQVIRRCRKNAALFAKLVKDERPQRFQILHPVQLNVVAFTVYRKGRGQTWRNSMVQNLYSRISQLGDFFIGESRSLDELNCLEDGQQVPIANIRLVFANPCTTEEDVTQLHSALTTELGGLLKFEVAT